MAMSRERFMEVIENEWTPAENSKLWNESVRYLTTLPPSVRPTRQAMAGFCKPFFPERTLSAIENHVTVMGYWPSNRRNNRKSKRRKKARRPTQFVSSGRVESTPTPTLAGKVKLERTFKCPGCGLKSEVI